MRFFDVINNFTRGEIGKKVSARTDTEAYNNSCEVMDNFIPQSEGGAKKRDGTVLVPDDIEDYSAVHSFKFSRVEDYRIYMGITGASNPTLSGLDTSANIRAKKLICRVYSNDRYLDQYFDFDIRALTHVFEMDNLDLQDLHYAQWEDIIFFTDPRGEVAPFYIYRRDAVVDINGDYTETNLAGYVFDGGFWCDPIHSSVKVSFGQNKKDTATTVGHSNPEYYEYFEYGGEDQGIAQDIADDINFSKFPYEFYSCSKTSGSGYTVTVGEEDTLAIDSVVEGKHYPVLIRDENLIHVAAIAKASFSGSSIVFSNYYDYVSSSDFSADAEAMTFKVRKSVISSGNDTTIATGFLRPFNSASESVNVSKIGLPEWINNNWPQTVCVHQQRLIFGGSRKTPTKIWCSKTGNPFIFTSQPRTFWTNESEDTDAFNFKPVTGLADPIASLTSMVNLVVGTRSSISNVLGTQGFNRRSINVRKEHGLGLSRLQAQVVGSSMVAIDSSGKKLTSIEIIGDTNDRTKQQRITDQNQDIINNGFNEKLRLLLQTDLDDIRIKKILWSDQDRVLWILNNIGGLVGVRLDLDNSLLGFFRVTFQFQTLISDMCLQSSISGSSTNLYLITSDDKVLAMSNTSIEEYIRVEDYVLTADDGSAISSRYLSGNGNIYLDRVTTENIPKSTTSFNCGYAYAEVSIFEHETGQDYDPSIIYSNGETIYYAGSYFRARKDASQLGIAPDHEIGTDLWKPLKTKFMGTFNSDKDGLVDFSSTKHDLSLSEGEAGTSRPLKIMWGFNYSCYAETTPLTFWENRKRRSITILELILRVYKSRGGMIGTSEDNLVDIEYKSYNNEINIGRFAETNTAQNIADGQLSNIEHLGDFDVREPGLFTGSILVEAVSDKEPLQKVIFEQNQPFPFYVVGLFVKGEL